MGPQDNGWYVKPLRPQGYAQRPHYYPAGEATSLCGRSARGRVELPFDPETHLTTVNDPRLGAPQFRRGCELCAEALRWAEAHPDGGAVARPMENRRSHHMRVHVTIEREDDDEAGDTTSMGVSAEGLSPYDVCKLLLAGAEMVVYDMVRDSLTHNGGDAAAVSYAAPLRTRLYVIETLVAQEPTPYDWVHLDMS